MTTSQPNPASHENRGRGPSRRAAIAGGLAALALPWLRPARAEGEIRIPHVFGETVLPKPATRVVSLGFTTQDPLLALGVPPLAVRAWFGDQPRSIWPWAQPFLNGATPTVITGEVAMETVASMEPDLIVATGSGISQDEYAILAQIAPTLMQAPGDPAYGTPWDALTLTLGRALGREALAQERVDAVRQRFAEARARHPDWAGRTALAAYHFGGETGIFTAGDTRGRFLAELGFRPPEAVAGLGGTNFYANLSPEDLSPLEVDLLVWISSLDEVPDLAALPMRKLLKTHAAGREVMAGSIIAGALSFGSVLSLPFALERLEGDIALAIDGDPATVVPSAAEAGLAP